MTVPCVSAYDRPDSPADTHSPSPSVPVHRPTRLECKNHVCGYDFVQVKLHNGRGVRLKEVARRAYDDQGVLPCPLPYVNHFERSIRDVSWSLYNAILHGSHVGGFISVSSFNRAVSVDDEIPFGSTETRYLCFTRFPKDQCVGTSPQGGSISICIGPVNGILILRSTYRR